MLSFMQESAIQNVKHAIGQYINVFVKKIFSFNIYLKKQKIQKKMKPLYTHFINRGGIHYLRSLFEEKSKKKKNSFLY